MTDRTRDELAAELATLHHRLGEEFFATRLVPLLETDLTVQQLRALALVQVDGESTPQRLAEALGVSAATVSGILDRLTAAGMTRRTPDPADGRVRRVTSTERGSEAIRRLVAHDDELPPELLALLDVEDLRALVRGTRALLEAATRLAPAPDRGGSA
ncbi:MarR family winged helix-turn-helix transcriptional regulator [Promicromonospora thailandica]|uniref:DNA-binding transcriptional regulator, MarR family n=1 Tax=Promicromonospora thailandica TaxID=765201 RepID=A0A9X2JXM1_9MICO|nr:MarR family transcriptional regulator [Promicromonospora thailandica]MCP2266717.1 DNA-binding transcriptional regulator, MarR family [Promicromonospora thailandica]